MRKWYHIPRWGVCRYCKRIDNTFYGNDRTCTVCSKNEKAGGGLKKKYLEKMKSPTFLEDKS